MGCNIYLFVPLSYLRSKESQCTYHRLRNANEITSMYISLKQCICISLTNDTQCIYLINLRHRTPNRCPEICEISRFLYSISLLLYRAASKLQFLIHQKQFEFYFTNIITKEKYYSFFKLLCQQLI